MDRGWALHWRGAAHGRHECRETAGVVHLGPVRLGVGFNHLDRIHVFLELEVSDVVLLTLASGRNEFWCEFVPLFRLGGCTFSESACLEIAHVKRGNPPFLTLDNYVSVFEEGEDLARVDWRLARDLVLIRMVEQLHANGWLGANEDALPEPAEETENN